ncbi:melanocyte-stimulating hormone receptor-like [Oculina patagonica]
MVNVTEHGNHTTIQKLFCLLDVIETHQKIIISALNIPLFITALLGNVLIIAALQKPSSLHPSSKLLLSCLASTDFCVGLISQPVFVTHLMLPQNPKRCFYVGILTITISLIFCGVSLMTLTAISVDRLLALMLGLRYRQVVTLRRVWVFVFTFWLSNTAIAMTYFYNPRVTAGIVGIEVFSCTVGSSFCYMKIYLTLRHHQAVVQDHNHQEQPTGVGISLNIARYRKTVSTALWVQVTLLACYLPNGMVMALIAVTGLQTPSLNLAWAVTSFLVLLNSSLNPFLYCWKMREVRQAVKDTIRQLRCFSS